MKINYTLILHIAYWITILTGFYGSWQISYQLAAFDLGHDPIWSGMMGVPFPHHFIWGLLLNLPIYFLLTRNHWVMAIRRLKNSN